MEDSGKKKKGEEETAAPVQSTGGSKEDLKGMSLDELNKLLNEVLEQEDYLRAIAIRDEINHRKKKY
jgi:protein-arginine kinase activator protein McsA